MTKPAASRYEAGETSTDTNQSRFLRNSRATKPFSCENMAATGRVREAHEDTRKDLAVLNETVAMLHRRLRQLEERVGKGGEP